MIQPHEAIVGHWFNFSHPRSGTVPAMLTPDIAGRMLCNTSLTYGFEDFDPIPLTSQVLDKIGFYPWEDPKKGKGDQLCLPVPKKQLYLFVCNGEAFISEGRKELVFLCKVPYVHNMQALWLSLTEKNLKLQL